MSRIEGKPAGKSLFRRAVYAAGRRKVGRMVEPLAIAGHHSRLMFGMGMFEDSLARSHRADPKLKALAGLKAASLIGCPF